MSPTDNHRTDYAIPSTTQLERAIAANALAALSKEAEEQVFLVYKKLSETADAIRARMQFPPGGNTFNVMSNEIRGRRQSLRGSISWIDVARTLPSSSTTSTSGRSFRTSARACAKRVPGPSRSR
jgi:hypothetical protein